jgi:biopolymer transport protein ExbD
MSAGSSDSGQDVDLNLAPIIDCFTVLITYLLVSAAFISLTVLDVGVSASGQAAAPPPEVNPKVPPPSLAAHVLPDHTLTLKLTGGPRNLDVSVPIPSTPSAEFNIDFLNARLAEITAREPEVKEVNVTAEPTVRYRDLVKVIEGIKKTINKVFLAG